MKFDATICCIMLLDTHEQNIHNYNASIYNVWFMQTTAELLHSNTPLLKMILLHYKLFRQILEPKQITNLAVATATPY
jgi:hypothetical protein